MTGRAAPYLAALGAAAVAGASLLPWMRTGNLTRSGYGLAQALRSAGLGDVRLVRALFVAWFLLPLLAALAWTAAAAHRRTAAAIASMCASVVGIGTGIAVLTSGIETKAGPPVSIALGVPVLAYGVLLLRRGRNPA